MLAAYPAWATPPLLKPKQALRKETRDRECFNGDIQFVAAPTPKIPVVTG